MRRLVASRAFALVERNFQLGLTVLAILLLCPVFLLIAIAIRLETPGPTFFRQFRLGLGGRPFLIYKFRSMVHGTPSLAPSPSSSADPRLTRVGRFLRRFSLDELPQLLNVLKGDMNIVGPRAITPQEITLRIAALDQEFPDNAIQHELWFRRRASVKPGIVGLAQVNGRSSLTDLQAIQYDVEYVSSRSPLLDTKVILRGLFVAACGKGAN